MIKGMICFLWVTLSFSSLEAEANPDKKYQLSICSLFKNESRYLREWIEYHRLIGVDHFYLYDNASTDRSLQILQPYIRAGLVTVVYWPDRVPPESEAEVTNWALSTQLPAYENAVKYSSVNETQWLVILEVDEFLVPVQVTTLSELLGHYEGCSGLELTSDYFDASPIDVIPKRELLIATLELTAQPVQNIQKSIEKTIFRPDRQVSFTWPPYRCNFKEGDPRVKLTRAQLRINKYVNRFKGILHPGRVKEKLRIDNRLLTQNQTKELLECGFEIEDSERVIRRFELQLRKKLGLDTGWNW